MFNWFDWTILDIFAEQINREKKHKTVRFQSNNKEFMLRLIKTRATAFSTVVGWDLLKITVLYFMLVNTRKRVLFVKKKNRIMYSTTLIKQFNQMICLICVFSCFVSWVIIRSMYYVGKNKKNKLSMKLMQQKRLRTITVEEAYCNANHWCLKFSRTTIIAWIV